MIRLATSNPVSLAISHAFDGVAGSGTGAGSVDEMIFSSGPLSIFQIPGPLNYTGEVVNGLVAGIAGLGAVEEGEDGHGD